MSVSYQVLYPPPNKCVVLICPFGVSPVLDQVKALVIHIRFVRRRYDDDQLMTGRFV